MPRIIFEDTSGVVLKTHDIPEEHVDDHLYEHIAELNEDGHDLTQLVIRVFSLYEVELR